MNENTDKKSIAKQYYEGGNSPLSDVEWDALYDGLEEIGYTPDSGVRHAFPLMSLKKTFVEDELALWVASHEGQEVIATPKLDGSAVSILYDKGKFIRATTRGNGKIGIDVSNKMELMVPSKINLTKKVQIDGELVAPKSIPNARNYAAGSLNLKLVRDFAKRRNELRFVAYDMKPHGFIESWHALLEWLYSLGFSTVLSVDSEEYPTDGEVFRLDNIPYWEKQGFTSHHPKGSLAFKVQKEGVITTLSRVEWQTGKSGVVTPVAILSPIMIGDALVSRATLHNMAHIEELGLEIGCQVEVIRSGEIIPRIVRRVEEK
tara:strand:- start:5813 stop:6766 length:954 start_codon:yes stop_codon:yes gene_type:complete